MLKAAWMDAAEVISWIAFRDPKPFEKWHEFEDTPQPPRLWGYTPADHLLEAFQARAAGRPHCPTSRIRLRIRQLMRKTGRSAAELAAELRAYMQRTESLQQELSRATTELMDEVRNGRLEAWGRPADNRGQTTPGGEPVAVPLAYFLLPVTIDPDGATRDDHMRRPDALAREGSALPYFGAYYAEVKFQSRAVFKKWPARKPGQKPPPGQPNVDAWMLNFAQREATEGRIPKQLDAVKQCVRAIPATYRQGITAHKRLPDHLRRDRGRPFR